MNYQWTDWITHVPGQRLPLGTHVLVELKSRRGDVHTQEGTISSRELRMLNWDMADEFGTHMMITRFKLRSIAEETVVTRECELEVSQ